MPHGEFRLPLIEFPELHALCLPMRAWSARQRALAVAAATVVGTAVAWAVALHQQPFFAIADADPYLRIAAGRNAEVMQPFPSRQLGALLAAGLARLVHTRLEHGFLAEAALALPLLLATVGWLAARTAAPRWVLAALALTPFWMDQLQQLVYPDLVYAALLAVLMLLMQRGWLLAAAAMMFPLMLARESTSLTLLCFLAATWRAGRRRTYAVRVGVALAAFVAGGRVVALLAAHSLPNPEHLPPTLYMLAKLPWNFLRNVLGVQPWSDANTDLCRVPAWSLPVHLDALHMGSVHALGVCGVSFSQQAVELQVLLMRFGLLPLLAAALLWRASRGWGGRADAQQVASRQGYVALSALQLRDPLLRFAVLYGGLSLLLAPLVGAGFVHLFGYAWPLFLVAAPRLMVTAPRPYPAAAPLGLVSAGRSRHAIDAELGPAMGFLGLHLALYPLALQPYRLPGIAAALAIWAAGAWLLWRGLLTPGGPPEHPLEIALRKAPGRVPMHSSSVVKSS